jgi:uncharacterized membrane protein
MMSRKWIGPMVLLAGLVFAAVVYPSLPARIPTHWGMDGEVDGWSDKMPGAFLPLLIGFAVWLLLLGLRRIDPRNRNYESFDGTFWILLNVLALFFTALTVVTLGSALGWPIDVDRMILAGVALLFLVLGNYMPRLRSNFWMGIRTPWTLSSDRVWNDTHRVGGVTMRIGAIITLLALPFRPEIRMAIAIFGLVLAGFVPAVYSYFAWKREQKTS